MDHSSLAIIIIGSLFLSGVFVEIIAKKLNLPRVTLLLILGVLVGPAVFDIIPKNIIDSWFPVFTSIALSMIGFLMGNKLSFDSLRNIGLDIIKISIIVVLVTFILIVIGLIAFNVPLKIAILLAALSTATDPAATFDVIFELKSKTKFSEVILDIVAIDDVWCLLIFSMAMTSVHMLNGNYVSFNHSIYEVIHDIGGAAVIAIIVGVPAAYLSGRISPDEATLIEALGIVFLSSGLALYFNVSFILTSIMLGIIVTNIPKHQKCAFHAIEGIEWPFMVLFFVLAGASFDTTMLGTTSLIGGIYIIIRILARFIGGWLGGTSINSSKSFKLWIGPALLPQAGLAIGLGLITAQHFPEYKNIILPIILSSTIFFEILGPLLTRKAIINNA